MTVLFQAKMETSKEKKTLHWDCFPIGVLYNCHTKEGFPLQFSGKTFIQVGKWESVVRVSDTHTIMLY